MKKFGQKAKKTHVMDILECIKPGSDLTVGKRYLKLDTDQTGDNILTINDKDDRSILSMKHFKIVDQAAI